MAMRRLPVATLIVSCISFCAAGTHADASEAVTDSGSTGLQEIVVTARKREENIQKTPLAISAFSGEDLQAHSDLNLPDVAANTPSLIVAQTSYDPFSAFVSLRGQGATDALLESEPSVGVYIDGVYVANTMGTFVSSLVGVDRVEVLKGPQGTLYGRNTTGGAINIVTAPPNYDGVSGSVQVRGGNFSTIGASGDINLPIISNVLAARLAGNYTDQKDGYGADVDSGHQLGNLRTSNLRGALRFDPSDQLNFVLRGDFSSSSSGGSVARLAEVEPFSAAAVNGGVQEALGGKLVSPAFSGAFLGALVPALTGTATPAQLATFGQGVTQARTDILNSVPANRYDSALSANPFVALQTYGGSLTGTYSFTDKLSLKSISAYRRMARAFAIDNDTTPLAILESPGGRTDQKVLSQEFDLNGTAFANALKYVAGVFYYHSVGDELQEFNALQFINPANPNINSAHVVDTSRAAFGQATYALTDKLNLTTGLRYTREEKALDSTTSAGDACTIPSADQLNGQCIGHFPGSFSNLSYNVSVDYNFTDATIGYVRTGKGFKAGGQNERISTSNADYANYGPETATDYEIGIKTDLLNRRLRLNADYYHTNYKDIQLTELVAGPGGAPTSIIANAGAAKIDGMELDVQALPVDPLLLHLTGSWINTRFTEGEPLYSNNRFPGVAKWQASASAVYTVPTHVGDAKIGADYSWQSLVDYQPDNHDATSLAYSEQHAYGLLNARFSLNFKRTNTEIALYGRNLTDKYYISGALDVTGAGLGFVTNYLGAPRTYGGEITQKF